MLGDGCRTPAPAPATAPSLPPRRLHRASHPAVHLQRQELLHESTSPASSASDSPPCRSASFALTIAKATRSRSTDPPPPPESISHLTLAATSSAATTPLSPSYPSNATASPNSSSSTTRFILCSACTGSPSIGTPATTASSTEFHPQCVTNPPTDACASTSRCGAHDGTTSPLPLVRCRNPSGRSASTSSSGDRRSLFAVSSSSSLGGGARTTHRNRWPLASSPFASSVVCSALNRPMLPKQRNTTLPSGCLSSHGRHAAALLPLATNSDDLMSGPTQCTGGVGSPGGVQRPAAMASTARGSSQRKVLTMTPSQRQRHVEAWRKPSYARSSRSMTAWIACVAGIGGMPGTWRSSPSPPMSRKLAEAGGAGGEEEVGGHAELRGDVERGAGEHVEDDGGWRGGGGGEEEGSEVRVGDADGLHDERLVVPGSHGREVGRWEAVEGDGRVGGGDAGEERRRGARVVGRVDDDDGDGDATRRERPAELDHGEQVAHPRRRVQHHWPLHGGGRRCVRGAVH
nr:unnamed protein product [Digitaria exilis]